jgi:hypothetical protein
VYITWIVLSLTGMYVQLHASNEQKKRKTGKGK